MKLWFSGVKAWGTGDGRNLSLARVRCRVRHRSHGHGYRAVLVGESGGSAPGPLGGGLGPGALLTVLFSLYARGSLASCRGIGCTPRIASNAGTLSRFPHTSSYFSRTSAPLLPDASVNASGCMGQLRRDWPPLSGPPRMLG